MYHTELRKLSQQYLLRIPAVLLSYVRFCSQNVSIRNPWNTVLILLWKRFQRLIL